jgi:Domain of unknown function (DUF6285)
MHESPSSAQLVDGVIAFLTNVAIPNLTGHAQFSARISANALALVVRELEGRTAMDATAVALYSGLLDQSSTSDLAMLENALCDAIVAGNLTLETPGLLSALREVAAAQLTIDQPNYSGLKL